MQTSLPTSSTIFSDDGVDVLLRDGSSVRLRAVQPDDCHRVRQFFADLSPESRLFRFFTVGWPTEQMLATTLQSGDGRTVTLVAERANDICGVATWARESDTDAIAEVAFAISDGLRGCGLGTRILERLAEFAQPAGVARFEAWVLPDNTDMLHAFRDCGFRVKSELYNAVCHLVLDLARASGSSAMLEAPRFSPRMRAKRKV
jgi:GNAT superfamily N-acetyltransferase